MYFLSLRNFKLTGFSNLNFKAKGVGKSKQSCNQGVEDEERVVISMKGAEAVCTVIPAGMVVHERCRMNFTNKTGIDLHKTKTKSHLRSSAKRSARVFIVPFDSKTHLLFWEHNVVKRTVGVYFDEYSFGTTDKFMGTISSYCEQRNDNWEFTAQERIEYFGKNTNTADSLYFYHRSCDINFRTNCGIPVHLRGGYGSLKRNHGK